MKNIIVPTDFSAASKQAAMYAVSLAKQCGAAVHLINVVTPPVVIDDSILPTVMQLQADILRDNRKLMDEEISRFSKENLLVTGFVEEGGTMEIISTYFIEKKSDLVVMGMKGKGNSHSVFGSTTTSILQKFSFPTLVIPEHATFQYINQITLAADFNASIDMERYDLLLGIADAFDSTINILNVDQSPNSMKQEEVIGKMKTNLAFLKHTHHFHTIQESDVVEGISQFIARHPTDLLVMIAQKHSFFERLFGKVHTKAMTYQTEIPLLVLQNK